jgi:V/A-type H+-transporting ATPase subunit E
MTLEELKRQIMERSAEEIQAVRERSDREAAEILRKAEEEAAALRDKYLQNAERAAAGDAAKLRYAAAAELKSMLNAERNRIYDQVFDTAGGHLAGLRDSDFYDSLFRDLVEEAVTAVKEEPITLHVDRRDEHLCSRVVQDLGFDCEIVADLECTGGLCAGTDDGRVMVRNTLESRLERAKDLLRRDLHETLYG